MHRGFLTAATALVGGLCAANLACGKSSVEIIRDASGVPHVRADDVRALFHGAGYALAQDRLAQWELARRAARGRLAEILGASQIDADKAARLRDHTDAEWNALVAALPAYHRNILIAYLAGLNRHIDEAIRDPARHMPYEFTQWGVKPERWSLADLAATMSQSIVYYGSGAHSVELNNLAFLRDLQRRFSEVDARRIFDDVLPLSDGDAVPVIREAAIAGPAPSAGASVPGSSASAVAADRSRREAVEADGEKAYRIADDARRRLFGAAPGASRSIVIGPHRSANGHVLMLQSTADGPDVHLDGAGFDTGGWTFAAWPVPIMGRGPNFGWLITTGEEDMVDLFEEQLNPARTDEYRYQGHWRRMQTREVVIQVRQASPVRLSIRRTVHGPLVMQDALQHRAYAERNALWNRELDSFVALVDIARAHSLEDMRRAIERMRASFNVQYGGEDGTIAYWHAGNTPIRAAGVDPRLPTPGDGRFEWKGFNSSEHWPQVVNPAQGYLHVWNNKARADSTYGEASRYGATFRTYLGRELIESSPPIDVAALKRINESIGRSAAGVDLSLTSPQFFTRFLLQAADGDARLTDLVQRMQRWNAQYEDRDGDGKYDDPGLTIYRQWYAVAQRQLVAPVIGDWWHKIDDGNYIKYRTELLYRIVAGAESKTPLAHPWLPADKRTDELRRTLQTTRDELEARFHTPDAGQWLTGVYWKYLSANAVGKHPDHPPFPDDPDDSTRTAAALSLQPEMIRHNGSELWNALMEISPRTRGFEDVSPSGGQNQFISVDGKGNPHIADQVELHRDFNFKRFPMAREEVDRVAESRMTLQVD